MARLFTRIFTPHTGKEPDAARKGSARSEPKMPKVRAEPKVRGEPKARAEPRLALPEPPQPPQPAAHQSAAHRGAAPERAAPEPAAGAASVAPEAAAPVEPPAAPVEPPAAAPVEPPAAAPMEPPAAAPEVRAPAEPPLSSVRWGPAQGAIVENIVFLCHGMGSSAEGIIQIAPQLGTLLPTTLFVAPNGPSYSEASDGRLWFDARDRSPAVMESGARRAAAALDALIEAELDEAGLDRGAYALVGYSQGAMAALFTGLRRKPAPRAILSYAGALLAPYSLDEEMTGPVPVMLVHGLEDRVVPAFYSRDAEKALRALGCPVQAVYAPQLGHAIDGAVVKTGKQFLRRWLVAEQAGRGRSVLDG